jgi:hypothetical protein
MTPQETFSNQLRVPVQQTHFEIQIDTTSASTSNINFDLEFSKIKDTTSVQNSRNPLIKILVKKSMRHIVSNSNVETTYAGTKPLTSWSNNETCNIIHL